MADHDRRPVPPPRDFNSTVGFCVARVFFATNRLSALGMFLAVSTLPHHECGKVWKGSESISTPKPPKGCGVWCGKFLWGSEVWKSVGVSVRFHCSQAR